MWKGEVKSSSSITLVSHTFGYAAAKLAVTFIYPYDQASLNEPWQPINALFIAPSTPNVQVNTAIDFPAAVAAAPALY